MNEFLLRDATVKDAPTIADVVRQSFAEYSAWLTPPSGADTESVESVLRKMTHGHITLAIAQNDVVGCVFTEPREGFLYLGRLAVLPSWRRQGAGGALMRHAEWRAVQSGLPRVRLGVRLALPENQDYYCRLGYQPCGFGTHPGCEEPTFVWLEKTL